MWSVDPFYGWRTQDYAWTTGCIMVYHWKHWVHEVSKTLVMRAYSFPNCFTFITGMIQPETSSYRSWGLQRQERDIQDTSRMLKPGSDWQNLAARCTGSMLLRTVSVLLWLFPIILTSISRSIQTIRVLTFLLGRVSVVCCMWDCLDLFRRTFWYPPVPNGTESQGPPSLTESSACKLEGSMLFDVHGVTRRSEAVWNYISV